MPVTPPTNVTASSSRVARFVVAAFVLGGVLFGFGYWFYRTRASNPRGPEILVPTGATFNDYVGSSQCATCHPSIYEQQVQSPMFRSLTTVEEYQSQNGPLRAGQFFDAANAIRYSIEPRTDRVTVHAVRGSHTAQADMTYVVGSGVKGLTLVRELNDDELQEFRVSYYTDGKEWDFTPGQERFHATSIEESLGRRVSKAATDGCFRCHATLLVQHAGRVLSGKSELGVSCERCHGPGRAHIEAARRGEIVPPKNPLVEQRMHEGFPENSEPLARIATREMVMCGECHGLNDNSLPPDEQLAKLHVAALMSSKCYQQSQRSLRCTNCHDPHSNTTHGDSTSYVQTCLRCHADGPPAQTDRLTVASNPKQASKPGLTKICPIDARTGCIDCHMPVHQILRGRFTHHRIGVRREPGGTQPRPASAQD